MAGWFNLSVCLVLFFSSFFNYACPVGMMAHMSFACYEVEYSQTGNIFMIA